MNHEFDAPSVLVGCSPDMAAALMASDEELARLKDDLLRIVVKKMIDDMDRLFLGEAPQSDT